MSDLPIFNYEPLEKVHTFLERIGSHEAKELLKTLRGISGVDGCCWGNPCYYKSCLACFCRGNIKFLTASQVYAREGKLLDSTSVEYEDRKSVIRDEKLTKENLLPYKEHFTESFLERL